MALKKIPKKTPEFTALELTPGNTHAIFKQCLATKETPISEQTFSSIIREEYGFDHTQQPIPFDNKTVRANRDTIKFLLGQLSSVHQNSNTFSPNNGFYRYDGSIWTDDNALLMELYCLGYSSDCMSPFFYTSDKSTILVKLVEDVEPTLSPKDPNFAEWYKGYEAKMKKKPEGQEPADD